MVLDSPHPPGPSPPCGEGVATALTPAFSQRGRVSRTLTGVLAPLWSPRTAGGRAQHVAPLRRWRREDGHGVL